jgi:hypothetical protein
METNHAYAEQQRFPLCFVEDGVVNREKTVELVKRSASEYIRFAEDESVPVEVRERVGDQIIGACQSLGIDIVPCE